SPRSIILRKICSVQLMSQKLSMLVLVESRFFSSVMLMVFMVLAFRCCSFLLPITIHSVACECKSFPLLFIIIFPGSANRSVGGINNRHYHHVCIKRG